MYHQWEDQSLQHLNRLPARASFYYYDTEKKALSRDPEASANYKLLDGSWDFYLAPSPLMTPAGYEQEDYEPDGSWGTVTVPGCWQMQGYGDPVYSGAPYLFPIDPPYVADNNVTGCYRRVFTLPKSMEGQRIVLTFEGVGSMFYAYVNGVQVGMSKGSHMTAEFDVTEQIHAGENTIAVTVLRFCDGSYLEIQDMCHMSGIFRSVSLQSMPKSGYVQEKSRLFIV